MLAAPGVYTIEALTTRPHGSLTPHVSESKQSTSFDQRELTVGEVTGDEVTTDGFPSSFRT